MGWYCQGKMISLDMTGRLAPWRLDLRFSGVFSIGLREIRNLDQEKGTVAYFLVRLVRRLVMSRNSVKVVATKRKE